MVVEIFRLRIY